MTWWVLVPVVGLGVPAALGIVWLRRSRMSEADGTAYMRALGVSLVRLPGRLRRVAADPRTPRRARWWLIGLAVYIASPIDPIPDFLPVVGFLDEIILVPIILKHIRSMIPDDVWISHFPEREQRESQDPAFQ